MYAFRNSAASGATIELPYPRNFPILFCTPEANGCTPGSIGLNLSSFPCHQSQPPQSSSETSDGKILAWSAANEDVRAGGEVFEFDLREVAIVLYLGIVVS
jgi:hypothetical protein